MGWLVHYWTEIFFSHLAGWFITGVGSSLLDWWVTTGFLVHYWSGGYISGLVYWARGFINGMGG